MRSGLSAGAAELFQFKLLKNGLLVLGAVIIRVLADAAFESQ